MKKTEYTLTRDCNATLIPAGDTVVLPQGTRAQVAQALGGSATIQCELGSFRIEARDLDVLGADFEQPEPAAAVSSEPFSDKLVWEALKRCFDPEIPINIVDLGLIYHMEAEKLSENAYHVEVKMTLTAQGCGMGPSIAADAKEKIEAIPEVQSASVEIVWEPAWNPHMISETGRKTLGLD